MTALVLFLMSCAAFRQWLVMVIPLTGYWMHSQSSMNSGFPFFFVSFLFGASWLTVKMAKESDPKLARWMMIPVFFYFTVGLGLQFLKIPFGIHGNCSACGYSLRNLGGAIEAYKEKEGRYPRSLEALLPDYWKQLPACPRSVNPSTRVFYRLSGIELADGYGYRVIPEKKTFILWCRSHGFYGHNGERQPWYTPELGYNDGRDGSWIIPRYQGNVRTYLDRGPSLPEDTNGA